MPQINSPPATPNSSTDTTSPALPLPKTTIHSEQGLDLGKKQIRVLRLYPGERQDPIQCELCVVYLADRPYYEALSYAWGRPDQRRPVLINDRTVQVTVNLEAALRRLRRPTEDRHLWVDALCINQSDAKEKSHQVSLMREIYAHTAHGLLWLGEFEEDVDETPSSVMESPGQQRDPEDTLGKGTAVQSSGRTSIIAEDSSKDRSVPLMPAHPSTISRDAAQEAFEMLQKLSRATHHPASSEVARSLLDRWTEVNAGGLAKLMSLAWWRRIWTVQETVLPPAATIFCGSLHFPWNALFSAMQFFYDHQVELPVFLEWGRAFLMLHDKVSEIILVRELNRESLGMSGVPWLFAMFRNRLAAEKPDKVYALLGLIPNQLGGSLAQLPNSADYSLHWREAYERVTRSLVQIGHDLVFLVRAGECARDPALPSWVPDWSAQAVPTPSYISFMYSSYALYNASDAAPLTLKDSDISRELKVMGTLVDEIVQIEPSLVPWERTKWNDVPIIRRWQRLLESSGRWQSVYPSGGSYASAFWHSIVADVENLVVMTDSLTPISPNLARSSDSYTNSVSEAIKNGSTNISIRNSHFLYYQEWLYRSGRGWDRGRRFDTRSFWR